MDNHNNRGGCSFILLVFSGPKTEVAGQLTEDKVLAAAGNSLNYGVNGVAYSFTGATCVYETNRRCKGIRISTAVDCDDFEINLSFLDESEIVIAEKNIQLGSLFKGQKGKVYIDLLDAPGETLEV